MGIFNTRFFELMAAKSLIICPQSDTYGDILKDKVNCLMFNSDLSDFRRTLITAIEDDELRASLIENAHANIEKHSYKSRIGHLLDQIALM